MITVCGGRCKILRIGGILGTAFMSEVVGVIGPVVVLVVVVTAVFLIIDEARISSYLDREYKLYMKFRLEGPIIEL